MAVIADDCGIWLKASKQARKWTLSRQVLINNNRLRTVFVSLGTRSFFKLLNPSGL